MSLTTGAVIGRLTKAAKIGAKSTIEVKKVDRLDPMVLMAIKHSNKEKVLRLVVKNKLDMKNALQACLRQNNAYAYAFIYEGEGTEFSESLLLAKGDFNLLPLDVKYRVVSLQTGVKDMTFSFINKAMISSTDNGRVLTDWTEIKVTGDSDICVTEW